MPWHAGSVILPSAASSNVAGVGAETVVMPIERHLTNQIEVIRFCWHVYEIAGIEPGWEPRRGEPWLLTTGEMNMIERVKADFRGVVQLTVNELDNAGVGLVPSGTGDHAVVGELLLLDVMWDLSAGELAEAQQRAQMFHCGTTRLPCSAYLGGGGPVPQTEPAGHATYEA